MLSLASKKTDKPTSSYTIGFSHPGVVDERPFARLAAQRFRSTLHETSMTAGEFASFLPEYVWHMEEPVCEPAAVALYYVSKLARKHVKVLISGEGGDEAFAGYDNYRNYFWLEAMKRAFGPFRGAAGEGMRLTGQIFNSRVLKKYAPLMKADFEEYYLTRGSTPYQYFNHIPHSFYSNRMAERVDKQESAAVARDLIARRRNDGPLEKMLYVDTKLWLPDDLLIKADRMTMANSLELRVPFLDHKVLEFAARLPRNQKIRGWKMKYILKEALAKDVPAEILHRRKVGFPNPSVNWLARDLKDIVTSILLDSKSISRGYFRKDKLAALIEDNSRLRRYTPEIFSLVVLELWHRVFIDSWSGSPTKPVVDHGSTVAHLAGSYPPVKMSGHADRHSAA
jgi:asparagine synthase (glutamine-hydrolysing)